MKIIYAVLMIASVGSLSAQTLTGPSSYSILVDQDYLQSLGGITDKNYTMGLGFKVSNHALTASPLADVVVAIKDKIGTFLLPDYLYYPYAHDSIMISRSGYFQLSGNGFTPEDLNTPDIQYDDRPYSSLLLLSYNVGRLYVHPSRNPRFYQTEISIGVLGSGVSAQLQTGIHHMMNNNDTERPYTPKGWHNQISNGGEPTLLIVNRSRHLIYSIRGNPFQNWRRVTNGTQSFRLMDLSVGKETFFGYYTGAAISVGGRFGILDFRNWLSTIFPLQNVAQLTTTTPAHTLANLANSNIYRARRGFELYITSEFKPTLMVYNALLEGQFRKSAYTISGNNTNPFIYSFNNGLVLNVPVKQVNINLTYNFFAYKSPEFRRANYYGKGHSWGGAYITVLYFPN